LKASPAAAGAEFGAASLFTVCVSDAFAEWIQNGIGRLARPPSLSFS